VAEKNYTKGVSPTVIFCSPSRPKGGAAFTGGLNEGFAKAEKRASFLELNEMPMGLNS